MKKLTTKRRNILVAAVATISLFGSACGETAAATDEHSPAVASLPADDAGETSAGGGSNSGTSQDDPDQSDTKDDTDQGASDDDAGLTPEEAQVAFSQCLKDEGVDDPFNGPDGEVLGEEDGPQSARFEITDEEDAAAFESALDKCNQIFEDNFGEFDMSPEQEAEAKDLEAAFNQCMANEGFPSVGGGFEIAEGTMTDFEAASDECQSIFDDSELFGQEN